jgi:hypothetical protein
VRLAYVGHSHHQVTGSTRFVIDLLGGAFEVSTFWDDSWLSGIEFDLAPVLEGSFDAVVVFQSEAIAARLAAAGLPNLTFFPMYDGCHALPDAYWRSLGGTKVVSFSSTLHERLQQLGLRSRFVQYFPDPAAAASVDHSTGLSGYFWQRQQDITWRTIRPLLGAADFRRFTLHRALDPSFGELVTPAEEEVVRLRIRITTWFPDRQSAAADLAAHNVYFAPRIREGIGMSFLEAMAMGFLVVAPDQPTMNEYIVHGLNGLLYDPVRPEPLDFAAAAALGARARRSVELGHAKWLRCREALLDFVVRPTATHPAAAPIDDFDPLSAVIRAAPRSARPALPDPAGSATREGGRRRGAEAPQAPRVTIAVVTRNAEHVLRPTLESILSQDFQPRELVVVDGASDDGTIGILRDLDQDIDWWRSAPDGGPFEAMNAAAQVALGTYIIFMNAGDRFQSTNSLSLALDAAPPEADVVFGHHVYRYVEGHEAIHRAAPFERTWSDLQAGKVSWRWLSQVPGHQATLVRAELLRRNPFRTQLRIAADHDLLYRLAAQGARFHHAGEVLATYAGGGLSWRQRERCFEEWHRIALEHTARPELVERIFQELARDVRRETVGQLSLGALIRRAPRDPMARAALSQALVHRLARAIPRPLRPARRTVVEFARPDLSPELRHVEGLSPAESWGRWTEGGTVRLELTTEVRRPGRIIIRMMQAFGPNVGKELRIRAGQRTFTHLLAAGEQTFSVAIRRADRAPVDCIELTVPAPTSPQQLGYNEDRRLLGLALRSLEVVARR